MFSLSASFPYPMVVLYHVVMKEIRIKVKIQELWRLIMELWEAATQHRRGGLK